MAPGTCSLFGGERAFDYAAAAEVKKVVNPAPVRVLTAGWVVL